LRAAQDIYWVGVLLTIGNAGLLLAISLYNRAVRCFDNHADTFWMFMPVRAATFNIFGFAAISTNSAVHVRVASVAQAFIYFSLPVVVLIGRADMPRWAAQYSRSCISRLPALRGSN